MGVNANREMVPRAMAIKFKDKPTAQRTWSFTVDGATNHADIIQTLKNNGCDIGSAHPEFAFLKLLDIQINEIDKYHAEALLNYGIKPDLEKNPVDRPDVWHFSIGGASVACTRYYFNDDTDQLHIPLENTAQDPYEGIMVPESTMHLTISSNRNRFFLETERLKVNTLNRFPWLGCDKHTWLCTGVSGEYATEMVEEQEVKYWKISYELEYRISTHNLFLPNSGFNYIKPGTPARKMRAWVRSLSDPLDTGSEVITVACTMPVALKDDGDIDDNIEQSPQTRVASIKEFRIYKHIDFADAFGDVPPGSNIVLS